MGDTKNRLRDMQKRIIRSNVHITEDWEKYILKRAGKRWYSEIMIENFSELMTIRNPEIQEAYWIPNRIVVKTQINIDENKNKNKHVREEKVYTSKQMMDWQQPHLINNRYRKAMK